MSTDAPDDVLAQFEDVLNRTIVDCEVNSDQWTLMHRYNKAAELLDMILNVSFWKDACRLCSRSDQQRFPAATSHSV